MLRYGCVYGPGTGFGPGGASADDVRRRRTPIVGRGDGLLSFVHVEDAAAATVLALDHGAAGVSNVTDDEPIAQREWVRLLAATLGAPPPRRIPAWVARLVAGPPAATAVAGHGQSNAKARRELGFVPVYPSVREGFPATFGVPAADPGGLSAELDVEPVIGARRRVR